MDRKQCIHVFEITRPGCLALRCSWMPEGVDPDFRVPVLHSPRTRRQEQLRMAGNVAARTGTLHLHTASTLQVSLRQSSEPASWRATITPSIGTSSR